MREAIGGSWIIYMVMTFIMVYVFFISFIMNYAAAYRAANYAITQIENCQGRMDECKSIEAITNEVTTRYHYHASGSVIHTCYSENGKDSYVFRVALPVYFELPIIGEIGVASVKAETKTILNVPNVSSIADIQGSCS